MIVAAAGVVILWKALDFPRESPGYSHGRRHDPFPSIVRSAGKRLEENYSGAQTPYFDRNEKELFFPRVMSSCVENELVENAGSRLPVFRPAVICRQNTHESKINTVSPIFQTNLCVEFT